MSMVWPVGLKTVCIGLTELDAKLTLGFMEVNHTDGQTAVKTDDVACIHSQIDSFFRCKPTFFHGFDEVFTGGLYCARWV